jgi:GT2 family glycosyltransferase
MESADQRSGKAEKHRTDLVRELAYQLHQSREEAKRLAARVAELKGSWSYRLSSPVRLVERLVVSLRKRSTRDSKSVQADAQLRTADPSRIAPSLSLAESYQTWIDTYDQVSAHDLKLMRDDIRTFARRPVFSVGIIAGASASDEDLIASLGSLCDQVYPDLEILVCSPGRDDAKSPHSAILADPRVRFVASDEPPGPAMFNALLSRASGEYFLSIDPGDLLSPHAIYLAARAALATPAPRVVYADEDALDGGGARCNPFFKPGWNPELALAFNYVGTAVAYRIEALRKLDGARTKFSSAAWRWDLMLRATNAVPAQQISRLPFLTCHLGAASHERQRNEVMAGSAVVADELVRRGEMAKIAASDDGYLVLTRSPAEDALLKDAPHVTIVIATRDQCELLRRCVGGILHRTKYPRFDIIIVDNDSRDAATLEYFRQLQCDSRVSIVSFPKPFNFSAINNMAAEIAHGEILAIVNNDIDVIAPHWLAEMVGHAVNRDVGAVGAKLYYPDDTIQHAGVVMGLSGVADHIFRRLLRSDPGPLGLAMVPQDVSAVTGACMVMRRSVYREVGGMDEAFMNDFNDVDLCLKLRDKGLRVIWTPNAELYHLESATRRDAGDNGRSRAECDRLLARWHALVADDPFFNPNLSLTDSGRVAAFPPRVQRPWIGRI